LSDVLGACPALIITFRMSKLFKNCNEKNNCLHISWHISDLVLVQAFVLLGGPAAPTTAFTRR